MAVSIGRTVPAECTVGSVVGAQYLLSALWQSVVGAQFLLSALCRSVVGAQILLSSNNATALLPYERPQLTPQTCVLYSPLQGARSSSSGARFSSAESSILLCRGLDPPLQGAQSSPAGARSSSAEGSILLFRGLDPPLQGARSSSAGGSWPSNNLPGIEKLYHSF